VGKKAAARNPLHSRISGSLGLYTIVRNFAEGESDAVRALEFNPHAGLTITGPVTFQKISVEILSGQTDFLASPSPILIINRPMLWIF